MERITIKDLTEKLNEVDPVSDGMETSEVLILEDTIWGLENGVYKPLGELQLPVQYANGKFEERNDIWYNSYDLFTLFTNHFFDGFADRYEEKESRPGRLIYPQELIDHLERMSEHDRPLHIHCDGASDCGGAKKLVHDFLSSFFERYQELRTIENQEARECLQRSFIKY